MNIIKLLNNRVDNYSNFNKDNNFKYDIIKCFNKKIDNMIKYNKHFNNLSTDTLYSLYIIITYKTNDYNLYKDAAKSYNLHKQYINQLNDYLIMIDNYEIRKYVYNLLTNKDIIISDNIIDIITPNISKIYELNNLLKYNMLVNEFKQTTINNINVLINIIHDNEKQILYALIDKLNNTYKSIHKFNKPELYIYNKLIELKNDKLICIFNHFTLPLSRNNKHPLYADFLLLFNINNRLIFGIIEYDGPSHYNINYYNFSKDRVYCDILKNQFCIDNNINILRIFDYDNIDYKIDEYLMSINNDNTSIILPSKNHYDNLLKDYH